MRRILSVGLCATVFAVAALPALADGAKGLRAYKAVHSAAPNVRQNVIYLDTDFLKPIRLSQPAGNLVVGNPFIADVIPRDDQYLFLSGKSAGHTNLLVYDKAGTLVSEYQIHVSTSKNYTTLLNGPKTRSHFECMPVCERVMRVEDSADESGLQAGKIGTMRKLIQGEATAGKTADAAVSGAGAGAVANGIEGIDRGAVEGASGPH